MGNQAQRKRIKTWGVNRIETAIKKSIDWLCPHDGCSFNLFSAKHFMQHVVGFEKPSHIIILQCPRCSRYFWVHAPLTLSRMIDDCPLWPK